MKLNSQYFEMLLLVSTSFSVYQFPINIKIHWYLNFTDFNKSVIAVTFNTHKY